MHPNRERLIYLTIVVVIIVIWDRVLGAKLPKELDEMYPPQRDSYLDDLFGFG